MNKRVFYSILCILVLTALTACSINSNSGLSQADSNGTAVSATLSSIVATSNALISTSSPATSTAPTVEPGSNMPISLGSLRLVYLDANRNIWVWNEGGSPNQLTSSNDVTQALISPDGGTIAYFRSADNVHVNIWAIQADGSNSRQLVGENFFSQLLAPQNALAMNPIRMGWVAGTLNLLFNTGATFEMGSAPSDDLWIVNSSTGSSRNIKEGGNGGNFTVSPDGKKVAVVRPSSLSIFFLDGSFESNPLSYQAMITYSEGQYYPTPIWSADSTHLRIVIPPVDPLADPNSMTISVYDVAIDGSPAVLLDQFQVRPFSYFPISPDLQWLLYLTTDNPSTNSVAVHLASLSASQDIIELTAQLDNLLWLPSSNGFVAQISNPESSELYSLQPMQYSDLTDTKRVENIQFIDNSRFFFFINTGSTYELRLGSVGYPGPQPSTLIATLPYNSVGGIPTYSFTK
jgi:hypothetical protein